MVPPLTIGTTKCQASRGSDDDEAQGPTPERAEIGQSQGTDDLRRSIRLISLRTDGAHSITLNRVDLAVNAPIDRRALGIDTMAG